MNNQCQYPAVFRYTWPGRDEKLICVTHALELKNVANTMGFHLQLITLSMEALLMGESCQQMVKD